MGRSIRGAAGTYRRTLAVAGVTVVLLVVGLRPATGQPAAPQQTPFSNGAAKATAQVVKIAPGVGSLELAIASGTAVAELKNQLAQSQAQSFDLGLIGTTLTAEGCSDAALTSDQLPQPTRVDNREGNTVADSDEMPMGPLGGGREHAEATTTPSSKAVATTLAAASEVISVGSGRATAVTEVIDGAARQAHASVQADVTIAGVVQLQGLVWDAVHRTGADPHAAATFDIGTARLAGAPIPLESLQQVEQVINTALAQTGISIEMPRVERFEEPTDLIRITPLRITLRDSPLGKTALGPGLNASRVQREELFNQLSAAICEAAGILLVGDIGVSILSGTGFIRYDIGGAEAISGEFLVENPFGALPRPVSLDPPAAAPGAGPLGAAPGLGAVPPAATAETPVATQPAASIGPLEELCESVHPFDWPSCSEGAMVPLGLLGLAATGVAGGLDWRHQRRRMAVAATGGAA